MSAPTTPIAALPQKRVAGETTNLYYPINTTTFDQNNQVQIQIPSSQAILDFSRAYIMLEATYSFDRDVTPAQLTGYGLVLGGNVANPTVAEETDHEAMPYIGAMNAANIFDQIQLYIGGKVIYDQQFAQVNQRMEDINKSQNYLESEPNTFVNINNPRISEMNQFLYHPMSEGAVGNAPALPNRRFTLQFKIPLEQICPVFRNINDWPAFAIGDTLNLLLNISSLNKYLCAFYTDPANRNRIVKITPLATDNSIPAIKRGQRVNGAAWQGVGVGDDYESYLKLDNNYTVGNIRMIVPSYVPTAQEQQKMLTIMNGPGLVYGFRTFEVAGQTTKGFENDSTTQDLYYNITRNNIYGVAAIALDQSSECVFRKPFLTDISCSLNNNFQLAPDTFHTRNNWTRGEDLNQTFLAKNGTFNFKHLQRVSESFLRDIKTKTAPVRDLEVDEEEVIVDGVIDEQLNAIPSVNPEYGSYFMYFNVSPEDSLGLGSYEFANLSIFKCKTGTDGEDGPIYGLGPGDNPISRRFHDILMATNHANCRYYLGVHSLNVLHVKANDVSVYNPSAPELNAQQQYEHMKLNPMDHGLVTTLLTVVPSLVGAAVKGIKKLRDRKKNKNHGVINMHYLRSKFGPAKAEAIMKGPYGPLLRLDRDPVKFRRRFKVLQHGLMEHTEHGESMFDARAKKDGEIGGFSNSGANTITNINEPFDKRMYHDRRFAYPWAIGARTLANRRRIKYGPGQYKVLPFNASLTASHGLRPMYSSEHGFFQSIWKGIKWAGKGIANLFRKRGGKIAEAIDKGSRLKQKVKQFVPEPLQKGIKYLGNQALGELDAMAKSYWEQHKNDENFDISKAPAEIRDRLKKIVSDTINKGKDFAIGAIKEKGGEMIQRGVGKLAEKGIGKLTGWLGNKWGKMSGPHGTEYITKYYAKHPGAIKYFKPIKGHDKTALKKAVIMHKFRRQMKRAGYGKLLKGQPLGKALRMISMVKIPQRQKLKPAVPDQIRPVVTRPEHFPYVKLMRRSVGRKIAKRSFGIGEMVSSRAINHGMPLNKRTPLVDNDHGGFIGGHGGFIGGHGFMSGFMKGALRADGLGSKYRGY